MAGPTTSEQLRAAERYASIREDISARLLSITAGMSREDFGRLIDQMALVQFNAERRLAEAHLASDTSQTAAELQMHQRDQKR